MVFEYINWRGIKLLLTIKSALLLARTSLNHEHLRICGSEAASVKRVIGNKRYSETRTRAGHRKWPKVFAMKCMEPARQYGIAIINLQLYNAFVTFDVVFFVIIR